jgi:hypothetical protein
MRTQVAASALAHWQPGFPIATRDATELEMAEAD